MAQNPRLSKLLIFEKRYDGDPGVNFEWPDSKALKDIDFRQSMKLKQVDCTWPRGQLHKIRFYFAVAG